MRLSPFMQRLRTQRSNGLLIVLSLGLGMAATTIVFSVFDAMLLRPLPYHAGSRVKLLWTVPDTNQTDRGLNSPATYLDLRREASGLESVGAFYFENLNLSTLPAADIPAPERLASLRFLPGFFETLGVEPILGHLPGANDHLQSAPKTVLVTWDFFERRLGANPNVLGQTLELSGSRFQLVGVLPRDFRFPSRTPVVFAPAQLYDSLFTARQARFLHILVRVQAESQLTDPLRKFTRGLKERFPADEAGYSLAAQDLRDYLVGADTRRAVALAAAGVLLLLLIATLNATNLLYARGLGQAREHAMRLALGARPSHLLSSILLEGLAFSSLAALLGWLVSLWGIDFVKSLWRDLPTFREPGLDWRVSLTALLFSALVGIVASLGPAWQAGRRDVQTVLRRSAATASRGGWAVWGGLLISIQIGFALVLLTLSIRLGDSLLQLQNVQPGFRTNGLLSFSITLPWETPFDEQISFFRVLRQDFASSPLVRRIAYAKGMPAEATVAPGFRAVGSTRTHALNLARVSADYFTILGIPMRRGRPIQERDGPGQPRVAVLSESAARLLFNEENPLGKTLLSPFGQTVLPIEVIGVVSDLRSSSGQAAIPTVYTAFQETNWPSPTFFVEAKGASQSSLLYDLRLRLKQMRPQQAIHSVQTMDAYLDDQLAGPRSLFLLMGVFAFSAAVLSALGLHGILVWFVGQRRGEIAVRLALGATSARVATLIMQQAVTWIGLGLLIGTAFAFVATRIAGRLLPESHNDSWAAFTLAVTALASVSCLALLYPLWQARSISAQEALRVD